MQQLRNDSPYEPKWEPEVIKHCNISEKLHFQEQCDKNVFERTRQYSDPGKTCLGFGTSEGGGRRGRKGSLERNRNGDEVVRHVVHQEGAAVFLDKIGATGAEG